MIDEVRMAFENNRLPIIAIVALILGLLVGRGRKKCFIIPGLVLSLIILNPLLFSFWYRFSDRAYWRLLWILPIIPVIAFVPAFVVEEAKKTWLQIVSMVLGIGIIFLGGQFVFSCNNTTFAVSTNTEKLPNDVVMVGEALLEMDNEPYVVSDANISIYLRQYSGKIKSLYSRDIVYGYVNSPQAEEAYNNLSRPDGDLKKVAAVMLNYNYKYLVTENAGRAKLLQNAGFVFLQQVGRYGIYSVSGNPTEIREYNKKHQVISITYKNEDRSISEGYTTIHYSYYEDGSLASESTFDDKGELVNCNYGYAIKRYVYYGVEHESIIYYFDQNGNQLEMGSGYFHDYLQSLQQKDVTIFISARDDASAGMTRILVEDMRAIGLKEDLRNKFQYSYCAVVSKGKAAIEKIGVGIIMYNGNIDGIEYELVSAGLGTGNISAIIVNGVDYSINQRGLNIVVVDNTEKKVIDSCCVDTYMTDMLVYH